MNFKLKMIEASFPPLRVTPDPDQAAMLQRKLDALSYSPSNGFHRDLRQCRQPRLAARSAR